MATVDFINKALPVSEAKLITREVIALLERLGINGNDYYVLKKWLISILFNVKLKKRKARDVLKPFVYYMGGRMMVKSYMEGKAMKLA